MFIEKDRDAYCKLRIWAGDEEIAFASIHDGCDHGDWVDIDIPKGKEIIGFFGNNGQ